MLLDASEGVGPRCFSVVSGASRRMPEVGFPLEPRRHPCRDVVTGGLWAPWRRCFGGFGVQDRPRAPACTQAALDFFDRATRPPILARDVPKAPNHAFLHALFFRPSTVRLLYPYEVCKTSPHGGDRSGAAPPTPPPAFFSVLRRSVATGAVRASPVQFPEFL